MPWYQRTLRWGQTNITEIDPTRYDIASWRTQWQRTHTQGVIINAGGFQHNGDSGRLVHGLLGWDKLIPESMAMYQAGKSTFRLASKPAAEARMWMLDGMAGGLQPWWHHVGAYHEDRRMYHTAEPVYRWHQAHEEFLVNREPAATVGVVWSHQNHDFYGRDDADLFVELPWRGMTQALMRARIPYLPVHVDHIDREASQFSALILPNLGALSGAQVQREQVPSHESPPPATWPDARGVRPDW